MRETDGVLVRDVQERLLLDLLDGFDQDYSPIMKVLWLPVLVHHVSKEND